jgi:hypothetical protein
MERKPRNKNLGAVLGATQAAANKDGNNQMSLESSGSRNQSLTNIYIVSSFRLQNDSNLHISLCLRARAVELTAFVGMDTWYKHPFLIIDAINSGRSGFTARLTDSMFNS